MDGYPLKWITDTLAVGYAPRSTEQLMDIKDLNVDGIVNLCAECYDVHELEKDAGFEVLYQPIPDEEAPTEKQITETLIWMDQHKEAKKKVLVHCRYGVGRTGTVVLAYLLHRGVNFAKAEKMLAHTPAWPSTRPQKRFIDDYLTTLQSISDPVRFKKENSTSLGRFFRRLEAVCKWDD
jgi:protein tyrosine phosphatase (PTP) superfamily phosphohydrolase (DUF442 family)